MSPAAWENCFVLSLNQRLLEHVMSFNTLHKSQIVFLPSNRTTDRVFTLRTLILDKYVYNHKEKIYARFVDFKKVFDSVWHVGLLHKLFQILPSYL